MQELLSKLVSFQTTADNPEEIKKGFEYIASLFDIEKFETQIFEKNGKLSQLISFKGKDALKPKILLNGHFDVVPAEDDSQYEMRVEGDRALGRGTADMKGMAVVAIEVMQELAKKDSPPDVALLLNGDEEIGGENGVRYCVQEIGIKPQFVLCVDSTHSRKEIVVKEKGGLWLEIKVMGKTAHAAYLWNGENAVEKLFEVIQKIKEFVGPVQPEVWKSTVNVGIIETPNKTPNKVPAEATAVLDIRFTEGLAKTPDELFEKIQKLVPEVELKALTRVFPLHADEKHPLVQKLKQIADKAWGEDIPLHFGHGATDARFFAEVGVPAVLYGGIGDNYHGAGEWVDLKSLEQNKQILLELLKGT